MKVNKQTFWVQENNVNFRQPFCLIEPKMSQKSVNLQCVMYEVSTELCWNSPLAGPDVMLNFGDISLAAAQMNTRNSFGPIGLVYGQ